MKTSDVLLQLDRSDLDTAEPFFISVGHICIRVRALPPLADALRAYFADALTACTKAGMTVDILGGQSLVPEPDWIDWQREPGKTGRKDSYWELEDGRLIHKARTGVTFLQSPTHIIAFGPTHANPNQVVNFINTQILNQCKREGWQICHAAAVTNGTRSLAIAGLSGGGKSSSMLRMMDIDTVRFVTNDRLMVQAGTDAPRCLGIPKHPRINPGTILGNPRLHPMLNASDMARLQAMEPDDLWHLEEKHDLIVPDIYGADRIQYAAPLTDFWVLNWQRKSQAPTQVLPVVLEDRPDLLVAIMKSAGPFFQDGTGCFLQNSVAPDPDGYLDALKGVRVSEVSGTVDFDRLAAVGVDLLG